MPLGFPIIYSKRVNTGPGRVSAVPVQFEVEKKLNVHHNFGSASSLQNALFENSGEYFLSSDGKVYFVPHKKAKYEFDKIIDIGIIRLKPSKMLKCPNNRVRTEFKKTLFENAIMGVDEFDFLK
ncbi:hypothetical protein [uncultured Roseovarius sp.]|uniref:hypothetical protein n=1 Tax=uncultured Roseovarius sp. TaxID=293344 RepID=UPI00260D6609|nr:hypothetical protein [uncultured Roseovarius sp.]